MKDEMFDNDKCVTEGPLRDACIPVRLEINMHPGSENH